MLDERREVAPRAERIDADFVIIENVVLVLRRVSLRNERSVVLARVPQRPGRVRRVRHVEGSALDEMSQRRRTSRVPLRTRDGCV